MIYLDYAATSPLRREALEAMLPYLTQKFGNADSLHALGREAALAVTSARDEAASILGVSPQEIYFTSGGTEADNWAVRAIGKGRAALSSVEHAAVLEAASLRPGGMVKIPVGRDGLVRTEGADLWEGTDLLCVMAVNNETGCIQDIQKISDLAHERGAYVFSDCVQAFCSQSGKEILRYADAISLSGHKIGGPKGVGALVVKRGTPLGSILLGGEQERGLRGGTLNVAGIVGFVKALSLAEAERAEFCAHTQAVRDAFEKRLEELLGGSAVRDGENRAPNLSHITFESEGVLPALDLAGIAASGGAACSAHAGKPSHVMLAMGRSFEQAKRGVRFSFGAETSEEEALRAAEAAAEAALGIEKRRKRKTDIIL